MNKTTPEFDRIVSRALQAAEGETRAATTEDLLASLTLEHDVGCAFARLSIPPARVVEEYRLGRE